MVVNFAAKVGFAARPNVRRPYAQVFHKQIDTGRCSRTLQQFNRKHFGWKSGLRKHGETTAAHLTAVHVLDCKEVEALHDGLVALAEHIQGMFTAGHYPVFRLSGKMLGIRSWVGLG
jgi:hypothetical protein